MRDRGRFETVRRAELAQDVGHVNAGRLDADHERRGDLAVRVATGYESQHFGLARCQAEGLLEVLPLRGLRLRRGEIESRSLGK
jgi:hypothetical protein